MKSKHMQKQRQYQAPNGGACKAPIGHACKPSFLTTPNGSIGIGRQKPDVASAREALQQQHFAAVAAPERANAAATAAAAAHTARASTGDAGPMQGKINDGAGAVPVDVRPVLPIERLHMKALIAKRRFAVNPVHNVPAAAQWAADSNWHLGQQR